MSISWNAVIVTKLEYSMMLLNNLGKMKIYVPLKLQDTVATADVLFNDKCWDGLKRQQQHYFIVFKKEASSS